MAEANGDGAEPGFEGALAELEAVLRALEDGTTTLDEALARYERGVGLLRMCYGHLQKAEARIQQLTGTTADGRPDLKPFEHSAAVEKARPPRRRPAGNGDGADLF